MCSQVQDKASDILLPVMNHPSASACMRAAPVASGQVGHLSYLPPGPTGPLCNPFFAEALPSPGFLASPTSLFQFLAGRSPTGESSTTTSSSSSSQPVNSDVAAALLSLKQPVVHQQPLGLPLQTQLSPILEGAASKNDKTDILSSQGLLEDSGLDLNSSGGSHGMSSPESASCKTDLSPMLFAQATPCHPYWPYHSHGYLTACFQPAAGFACVRGRMRPNSCHICGKSYARASTLRTHLRTHNGEKPYQCSLCFKSFTQAANLTAHMRTHSGEKPFKCPMCDRRFSQSSSVTTHMRTHSGERPYKCTMCSKAFADSSTLTKHFRTHSGEKPYRCHICDAMFSQSGNLNRHMKTHKNVHF